MEQNKTGPVSSTPGPADCKASTQRQTNPKPFRRSPHLRIDRQVLYRTYSGGVIWTVYLYDGINPRAQQLASSTFQTIAALVARTHSLRMGIPIRGPWQMKKFKHRELRARVRVIAARERQQTIAKRSAPNTLRNSQR